MVSIPKWLKLEERFHHGIGGRMVQLAVKSTMLCMTQKLSGNYIRF